MHLSASHENRRSLVFNPQQFWTSNKTAFFPQQPTNIYEFWGFAWTNMLSFLKDHLDGMYLRKVGWRVKGRFAPTDAQ